MERWTASRSATGLPESCSCRVTHWRTASLLWISRPNGSGRTRRSGGLPTGTPSALMRPCVPWRKPAKILWKLLQRSPRGVHQAWERGPAKGGPVPYFRRALGWSGRRFARLALSAYDEQRISSADLTEYLRVKMPQVEQIRSALHKEDLAETA